MDRESGSAYSLTIWAAVGIIVALLIGFGALQAGYQATATPSPSIAAPTSDQSATPLLSSNQTTATSAAASEEAINTSTAGTTGVNVAGVNTVSGTVTGKSSIFGGRVQALTTDGSTVVQEVNVQSSDGTYLLSLADGSYVIKANRRFVGTGYLPYTTTVVLPPPAIVDVDFRELVSRTITGTLTGFSPEQLSGAYVSVRDAGITGPTPPLAWQVSITPTATGAYTAHVPSGVFSVRPMNIATSPGSSAVDTTLGNRGEINFAAALSVTGTVTLKTAPPFGSVEAFTSTTATSPARTGSIQSSGRYTVSLDAGTYNLRTRSVITGTGYFPISRTVSVPPSRNEDFDLAAYDSHVVTGTVSGLTPSELNSVWITARDSGIDGPTPPGTLTLNIHPNADGSYVLHLPPGSWRVIAGVVAGKVQPNAQVLDTNLGDYFNVDFAYSAAGLVTGMVTYKPGDQPFGSVEAYLPGNQYPSYVQPVQSNGRYTLTLPANDYMLRTSMVITGTAYAPITSTVSVPPDQVRDFDLAGLNNRAISGTIGGLTESELAGARVSVGHGGFQGQGGEGGGPVPVVSVAPSPSGAFLIHLPAGQWSVWMNQIPGKSNLAPQDVDTSGGNATGVDFVFADAYVVTGTVTVKSGAPSGWVNAYEAPDWWSPVSGMSIQPTGRYTLTLDEGAYLLRAQMDNYAPMTRTVSLPPSAANVDFNMAAADPWVIAGTVTGLDSDQLSGLRINFSQAGGGEFGFSAIPLTTTGAFTANLPNGLWWVNPDQIDGKVSPEGRDVRVRDGDVTGIELAYQDGSTITGTVTVQGALPQWSRVEAYRPAENQPSWSGDLDAAGRYTLTVPNGNLQLRTSVNGWFPLAANVTAPLSPAQAVNFNLLAANPHIITGTISGLDSSELLELWVSVSDAEAMGPGLWANALVDSDAGSFTIHVPNGKWRVQPGDVDGKVTPQAQVVDVLNGDELVSFSYVSGVTVSGLVTLRPGDSPQWSNIQVYSPGTWQPLYWAHIDDEGGYSVSLQQGTYEFRAQVSGYYPVSELFTVTMGTTNTLNFDLAAANPYSVTGSLAGLSDLPSDEWQFMNVHAQSNAQMGPGMWADARPVYPSGVFTLNMPSGNWRVEPPHLVGKVAPPSQMAQLSASQPHVNLLSFVFGSGYTISGTVYLNGTPASAWSGHVDAQDPATKMFVSGTSIGSGGSYALTLGPGSYVLRAQVQGYFPVSKSFLNLSENHLGEDFDIGGSGSYTITGLIIGLPDGKLPMASVWVQDPMNMEGGALWAQPDPSSRRYSVRVPEGTWRVMGNRVQGFGQPNPVTVSVGPDDPVATADMEYASGFMVSGTVRDPLGNPVPWTGMHLFNNDHSMDQGGGTQFDGSYEFGGLITGTYTLEVFMPWGMSGVLPPPPTTIEITGANVIQDIQFLTATKRIAGTVYKATGGQMAIRAAGQERLADIAAVGEPVEGADVFANLDKGGGGVGTRTDANGNYELSVGPGAWWVNVHPSFQDVAPDWTYNRPPTVVSFANDQTQETKTVDFAVQVTGSKVRGRILEPNGTPMEHGFVNLDQPGQWGGGAPILPNGTFTIPVQAGTYMMNIWVQDQRLGLPGVVTNTTTLQVANLRTGFSVADGETRDLGDITLVRKNAGIAGRVTRSDTGEGVEGVWIHAQSMMGPGWGDSQTDSNGEYQVWVNPGRYRVNASPRPDTPFGPTDGGETQVREDSVSTINIQLQTADSTISGRVVLASDRQTAVTDVYGGAFAFSPGSRETGTFAPIMGGSFELRVAAGSYKVGIGLPPGAEYSMFGEPVSVTVASGETANVQVLVASNSSLIQGDLREYPSGNLVTGLMGAMIHAGNGKGAGSMDQVDPEAGTYELRVASGIWHQHLELPPDSGYMLRPGQQMEVSVLADQTVSFTIQLVRASRTIRGHVSDPEGNAMAGAFVSVENATGMGKDRFVGGGPTDWNGDYSVSVAPGVYEVRAQGRFDLGYMSPPPRQVDVTTASADDVDFRFQGTNVTLNGQILRGGSGTFGMVRIHSTDGSGTMALADEDGYYTAHLGEGTWFMEAVSHDEETFYKSEEISRTLAAGVATQNFTVTQFLFIPPAATFTFDSTEMQVLRLSDGTEIQIPAGALAAEGEVTVSASPKPEMPVRGGVRAVNIGYTLTASDSDGRSITTFRSNVTIVLHYTDEQLEQLGITEDDLVASYWDETTSSWMPVANMSVDPDENTLSLVVDHFTDVAVTTSGSAGAASGISADFTAYPTSGVVPLTVVFTDTSTGSPTSWLWSFGDTHTSTERIATHTFLTTGVYTVALTASTDEDSDSVTMTNLIEVLNSVTGTVTLKTLPAFGHVRAYRPDGSTAQQDDVRADGSYSLALADGTYTLRARPSITGTAYAPYTTTISLPPSTVVNIDLATFDSRIITGTVSGFSPSQLDSMSVAVFPAGDTANGVNVRPTASGTYTVHVSPGLWTVSPNAATTVPVSRTIDTTPGDVGGVDFAAPPPASLLSVTGRVTLTTPSAFGWVDAYTDPTAEAPSNNGEILPSGHYTLTLDSGTYNIRTRAVMTGTGYYPISTTLAVNSDVSGLNFNLAAYDSSVISGTVTGLTVEELSGVGVTVRDQAIEGPTPPGALLLVLHPDPDGHYAAYVPGGAWSVFVSPVDGKSTPNPQFADTSQGGSFTDVDFSFSGGGGGGGPRTVTGTVTLKTMPANGWVYVFDINQTQAASGGQGGQSPVASAVIQPNGRYTVTVDDGYYYFRTSVMNYAPTQEFIEVSGNRGGVDFDLASADVAVITGLVTGLDSNQLADLSMNVWQAGYDWMGFAAVPLTTTGRYTANVPMGSWSVNPGQVPGKVTPEAQTVPVYYGDAEGIDFDYAIGFDITGTVTISGSMPQGSEVQAYLPDSGGITAQGRGMGPNWSASIDSSGRYTLTVPEGGMQLRTSVRGWFPLATDITVPISPANAVDFNLAAADAHVISGTISGLDSYELANLWIGVFDAGWMGPPTLSGTPLVDSESGSLAIHVPNGQWRLQPGEVQGKVTPPEQVVLIQDGNGWANFIYSSGETVSGIVTLRSGDSPNGGGVQVFVQGAWWPSYWAGIGEDGSYSVSVWPGTYEFRPQVNGYYPASTVFTVSVGVTNTLDFNLAASNPYSITGRITGVDDLESYQWEYMRVTARASTDMGPSPWAEAKPVEAGGVFTLNMPGGSWRVEPPQVFGKVAPASQMAELSAGQPHYQLLPFEFGGGYTISGTVYISGTPASQWSGNVDAQDYYSKMWVAGTPIGSGGSYALTLGAGNYIVRAQVPGYFPVITEVLNLNDNHFGVDFDVAASGSFTITGLVTGLPDGKLAMANVWLQNAMDMNAGSLWAQPDPSSRRYTVRVPGGTWRVMANRVPGFGQPNPVMVYVDENNPTATADMEYASGAMLTGNVTDPSGNPVPWVGLHLFNGDHSFDTGGGTDWEGYYEFGGLITGTYTLEVFMPWGASGLLPPDPATVEITSTGVVQDMQFISSTKQIVGTVIKNVGGGVAVRARGQSRLAVAAAEGEPVTDAQIFANQEKGGGGVWTATDSEGNYTLAAGPGNWWVNVSPNWQNGAPDWTYTKPPTIVSFAEDRSEETTQVDFVVQVTGGRVTGRVLQPNGTPLDNGWVNLEKPGQWGGGAPVQADGTFTIPVEAGTYMLNMWLPDQRLGVPAVVTNTTTGEVANLRTGFNVREGVTRELGDIRLVRKNSGIAGRVTRSDTGAGVEGVWVNAHAIMGAGWGDDVTDSNGDYQMWLDPGRYQVMASPWDPDFSPTDGGETVVRDEAASTVNIQLTVADATIAGRVVLANTSAAGGGIAAAGKSRGGRLVWAADSTPVTDIWGGAFAFEPGSDKTGAFGPLYGGTFELRVPAGTYRVGIGIPPGGDYSMYGQPVSVTVGSGETANVEVPVLSNNAVLRGDVREYPGGTLVTQMYGAMVWAGDGTGAGAMAQVDPETGTYELRLAPGIWDQHLELPWDSGYVLRRGQQLQVPVAAGETISVSLQVVRANRVISGHVSDPEGNAMPWAFVSVEDAGSSGKDRFVAGAPTDWEGNYSINVAPGQYQVRVQGQFGMGYMAPPPQPVDVSNESAPNVDIQFHGTNVILRGQVMRAGSGTYGMVRIYSEDGSGTMAYANEEGYYEAYLGAGTWLMEAVSHDADTFYKSEEISRTLSAGEWTQNITVTAFLQIPQSATFSFDAAEMQVLRLSDGTEIQIPAGALATEGTVTVSAVPKPEVPVQGGTHPVNLGYALTATDSDGRSITTFRSNVTIILHYTDEQLENLGITEDDLLASYWDGTTSSWMPVANMSVNPDENSLSFVVDHFTDVALTTSGSGSGGASPSLSANFTAYPVSGTAPLTVVFTDTTSGSPTSWLWIFGDGRTDTVQNPTHVFSNTGVYTVSLQAATADASDTVTKTNYITVSEAQRADLRVTKSPSTPNPVPDGYLFSNVTVSNIGGATAHNVLVTDTLPMSTTFASYTGTYYSPTISPLNATMRQVGNQVVWSLGDLPVGRTAYIYPVLRLGSNLPVSSTITNTIQVRSDDLENQYSNNTAFYTRTVGAPSAVDLFVYKYPRPAAPAAGNVVVYTVYVYNNGGRTATNIVLTDTLPVGVTLLDASGADMPGNREVTTRPTVNGREVVWPVGDLPARGNLLLYLTTTLDEGLPVSSVITNTLWGRSSQADASLIDNVYTATTVISSPTSVNVFAEKTLPSGQPAPGAILDYKIYFGNSGNATAHDIVLTDTLPVSASHISSVGYYYGPTMTPITVTEVTQDGKLVWRISELLGGSYGYVLASLRLAAEVSAGATVTNTVRASTSDAESSTSDNESTLALRVVPLAEQPARSYFAARPLAGLPPLDVGFVNLSAGAYTSVLWDFGDGVTSTLSSLMHTYDSPGTYAVTLTVSYPSVSSTLARLDYITVYQPVSADFNGTPVTGPAPLAVTFTNESLGYDTVLWNFGDGTTSTSVNPSHTYTQAGSYTVTLTVSGPGGDATTSKAAYITVYEPAAADFSATPLAGTIPVTVTFTNLSGGNFSSSYWTFGDGGTSSVAEPTHTYTTVGQFTVTLTVSGLGGTDTITRTRYITTDNWQYRTVLTPVVKNNATTGADALEALRSVWDELWSGVGRLLGR